LKDTAKHQGLRNQLAKLLEEKVTDKKSFGSDKENSKTFF
jgi:hypothetical protein